MGIIPNVMGIAVFSPKLDELGNSSKGIQFFKELMKEYSFHTYDNILSEKKNPILKHETSSSNFDIYNLLVSASIGDLNSIVILESKGIDLNSVDYDKRTALHLACSECQLEVIEYLINKKVNINVVDRWNNKPIDDITRFKKYLVYDDTPIYQSIILKCDKIINLLSTN